LDGAAVGRDLVGAVHGEVEKVHFFERGEGNAGRARLGGRRFRGGHAANAKAAGHALGQLLENELGRAARPQSHVHAFADQSRGFECGVALGWRTVQSSSERLRCSGRPPIKQKRRGVRHPSPERTMRELQRFLLRFHFLGLAALPWERASWRSRSNIWRTWPGGAARGWL